VTVTQARRKNIAKARAVLAAKRKSARDEARAQLEQTHDAFASLAGRPTIVEPNVQALASDDVTIQTLQAALDQAGWQLSVLGHRLKGLL